MSTPPEAKPAPTKLAPWAFAAPWGARGYVSDLDGPVHWIEFGDEEASGRDGTPIVFVHGLGGSHLNWCLIGPQLAEGRRAVALDLHGFGLTPGTRATSNVHHNAMLLNRFVREVTGTPVIDHWTVAAPVVVSTVHICPIEVAHRRPSQSNATSIAWVTPDGPPTGVRWSIRPSFRRC